MFAESRTVDARSNARTIGNRSSSSVQRGRRTKEMSSDPRGQYTGWRIAAIRSNETVGKCILARGRVVLYRKGGDIYTYTHAHITILFLSLGHSPSVPLSFPSSTFHPTLSASLAWTVVRVLIISLCRAFHGWPVIYAIYSGRVHTLRVATRP
jgi:hypothetical protein